VNENARHRAAHFHFCVPQIRMLSPLFLQSHVFLCRGNRHWVILDAGRDKYHCVNRRQFETLGPSLKGWEGAAAPTGDPAAAPADVVALAKDLLSLNILSEHASQAKDALPSVYPLPTQAIDPDSPGPSRWLTCRYANAFFASAARGSRELREKRFPDIIEQVRVRKARNAAPFDLERARLLAAIFDRLRPFYPQNYDCLPDSLRLIHFLARFGLFPDWVFGVIADPFEAHCWVQAGSLVLNDRLERVSAFTPIMSI
jgi:Transglutaminase-like superfamily